MDNKLLSVKEMIKDACENTGLDFDRLWCGENSQSFSLSAVMTEDQIRQADIHPETKQARKAQWELMSIIFQKYMDSYPANAVFKQKLYEDLMNCLQYVLDVYALVSSDKLKTALSKANSDAAEWKRQFREKQTEAERAEAERAEREKAVEDELRTLRRDKTVSGYQAQCLALGYTQELALRAAEAMADNDAAAIMACQQEFLDAKQKELTEQTAQILWLTAY